MTILSLISGSIYQSLLSLSMSCYRRLPVVSIRDGNREFPVGEWLPIPVPAGQKFPCPRPC
jgi:hypothetical protein